MPNNRFYKNENSFSFAEIINYIEKTLNLSIEYDNNYDRNKIIQNIANLNDATDNDLSVLSNNKYLAALLTTKAAICLVPLEFQLSDDILLKKLANQKPIFLIKSKNPYFIYAKLIELFYRPINNANSINFSSGISVIASSAKIAKTAKLGTNVHIGEHVVIEDNAEIGANTQIHANCFVGYGTVMGSNCIIHNNVSISYAIIGDDVHIAPGACIGQEGFGFATAADLRYHRIFHLGIVQIGNRVRIGANTTIDRGSLSDTVIGDDCCIDNLVQIAHNVQINQGSIIVAQVGIGGSTKIGKYCVLGGQVGLTGHISIGDKVQITAQSGVMCDIEDNSIVGGYPAVNIKNWHKQTIILKKLVNEYNQSK